MIIFKQVHKHYSPNQLALADLNLHIQKGEFVFIQGPSGAGKTTLLNLIAGIEKVSSGEIIVDEHPLHKLSAKQIAVYRRRLGIVSQKPMLLNSCNVYDNVAISLIVSGFPRKEIPKRVNAALEKVSLLARAKAHPCTLSGGEQQRLEIARAIVHKPTILLADEPTGNLDPELSIEMITLFSRFHQAGMTIVIATHDEMLLKNKLIAYTSRQINLKQGKITCFI